MPRVLPGLPAVIKALDCHTADLKGLSSKDLTDLKTWHADEMDLLNPPVATEATA